MEKKSFLSGIFRMRWGGAGGLTMPEFFGPFSRSAFLVNKKSPFLQKCQCIELLTVFLGCIYTVYYIVNIVFLVLTKLTFKS